MDNIISSLGGDYEVKAEVNYMKKDVEELKTEVKGMGYNITSILEILNKNKF